MLAEAFLTCDICKVTSVPTNVKCEGEKKQLPENIVQMFSGPCEIAVRGRGWVGVIISLWLLFLILCSERDF